MIIVLFVAMLLAIFAAGTAGLALAARFVQPELDLEEV